MKLYYLPGACSLADHIVLEWIGQPYEIHRVGRDELKSPGYLRLNPNGSVPTLEHDGFVLTQNAAILHYLADLYPETLLAGGDTPQGRAEVNRWLALVNADIHPTFKPLFGATAYLEDAAMIERTKQATRDKLRTYYEQVDAQLDGRDWIAGTRSIADPYLLVTLRWARKFGVDLSGLANVERYITRMEDDPGVRAAVQAES
jgi:glutathione S-transferase